MCGYYKGLILNISYPITATVSVRRGHWRIIYLFIQHLFSDLYTTKYALMRYL